METDILIIGSGPAGLQAAIHSSRRNVNAVVTGRLERSALAKAHIENLLGVSGKKPGMELLLLGKKQAELFGSRFQEADIVNLERTEGIFTAVTEDSNDIEARAVIFAMGVKRKSLGIDNIDRFLGKGLSYCADCDARFYDGKNVVVVGDESAAASGALVLSRYAKTTTLISERLVVSRILRDKLEIANVALLEGRKVVGIVGNDRVEGIRTDDGSTVKAEGLFVEVGSKGALELAVAVDVIPDENGYLRTDRKMATSIPGAFACGDITGPPFQLSKAIGEGCVAGLSAAEFVRQEV